MWGSSHHYFPPLPVLWVSILRIKEKQLLRWLESIVPWFQSIQFGPCRMLMWWRYLTGQSCPVASRNLPTASRLGQFDNVTFVPSIGSYWFCLLEDLCGFSYLLVNVFRANGTWLSWGKDWMRVYFFFSKHVSHLIADNAAVRRNSF